MQQLISSIIFDYNSCQQATAYSRPNPTRESLSFFLPLRQTFILANLSVGYYGYEQRLVTVADKRTKFTWF